MRNTIIYLIGFPGTGKYTIAKELQRCFPELRLVDNHLVNNLIFTLVRNLQSKPIPEPVRQNILKIWDIVFDTVANLSDADDNFIFTNVLLNSRKADWDFYENVKKVAENRNANFIPVRLLCESDVLEKRVVAPEREARHKLVNFELVRKLIENDKVIDVQHHNLLNLDTTQLSAADAVKRIIDHINKVNEE